MKLIDKRFWMAWSGLLLLTVGSSMAEGWGEDIALIGAVYALSLLSTWLYHRVRPKTASGNLIVMVAYNTILSYNIVFNSRYGAGLTWWFFALLLNAGHSVALLIYYLVIRFAATRHQ